MVVLGGCILRSNLAHRSARTVGAAALSGHQGLGKMAAPPDCPAGELRSAEWRLTHYVFMRRVDVLGVQISATGIESAVGEVARWIEDREQHYVCVTGVHGVMECQRDPELRAIHNRSGSTVPRRSANGVGGAMCRRLGDGAGAGS